MFYGYFNSIYNWIWSNPSSNTEDDKDGVVDFPKLPNVVAMVAIEREPTSIMDKYEEYHEHLNEVSNSIDKHQERQEQINQAISTSIDDPPWPGYGRKNKHKK